MSITSFEIALAIVRHDDKWLVALRRSGAHLGGLWEFPGGKRHPHETITNAALRELYEECGVTATVERVLTPITHEYETRLVDITPVLCSFRYGEAQPLASDACRWVTLEELELLDTPAANFAILRQLRELESED